MDTEGEDEGDDDRISRRSSGERVSRAGLCRPRESGRSMGEGFPPNPKLVRDRARLSCFVDVYVHLQSHIPSHDGVRTTSDQSLLHPCAIGHCPPDLVLQGPLLHHDSTEQSATFCDMAGKAHTLQCQKPMHLSCACRHSADRMGNLPKKPEGTAGRDTSSERTSSTLEPGPV